MTFRLRTGHCHLLPLLYRLNLSHTNECPCCTGSQTPEYILQDCPIYQGAMWIGSSTEKDCRLHSKDWTGDFSPKIRNRVDCQRSEKRSKTHKRLKERFLIGRNRTKRAIFRGSPLFQATYNIKTGKNKNNKKPSNSTYLVSVGCERLAEGKRHETDRRDKEKGLT